MFGIKQLVYTSLGVVWGWER